MSLLAELARHSLLAFAAVLFLLQIGARELGYALGRRSAKADAPVEGVGVVVTSMLGLLAFVLGLTLAYSNTRFQERRDVTLQEAQSIGTSWLRAGAVGGTQGAEIARLLETYIQLRLEFVEAPRDEGAVAQLNARTDELQAQIWRQVTELTSTRADPVVTSLLVSLNETFDLATAQRHAFASGPAAQLVFLLLAMAMASMGGLGYQFGLRGRPLRIISLVMLGMWTAVLVIIIDLGAPRLGQIRTDPARCSGRWRASGHLPSANAFARSVAGTLPRQTPIAVVELVR
ncbi:hypothetical protein [Sabulicella rubraurantiaca]|uniref:hypothetical protein n=1 Tax=Sabulicella rubraurantiaca TaxID=2811429 RepID=UPI001A969F67|nr:hypothetical protein [Sabulicella rubraurantiaca]